MHEKPDTNHHFSLNEKGKHPFRKTLGPPPYLAIGAIRPGHQVTCDHCGCTKLLTKFWIKAANEAVFGVGSECVKLLDLNETEIKKIKKLQTDFRYNDLWIKFQHLTEQNRSLLETLATTDFRNEYDRAVDNYRLRKNRSVRRYLKNLKSILKKFS